jgi:hypothetical protein
LAQVYKQVAPNGAFNPRAYHVYEGVRCCNGYSKRGAITGSFFLEAIGKNLEGRAHASPSTRGVAGAPPSIIQSEHRERLDYSKHRAMTGSIFKARRAGK